MTHDNVHVFCDFDNDLPRVFARIARLWDQTELFIDRAEIGPAYYQAQGRMDAMRSIVFHLPAVDLAGVLWKLRRVADMVRSEVLSDQPVPHPARVGIDSSISDLEAMISGSGR